MRRAIAITAIGVLGLVATGESASGACAGPACRAERAVRSHLLNRYGAVGATVSCSWLVGSLYRCPYSYWGDHETLCRGTAKVKLRPYLSVRLGTPHAYLGDEDWKCR